MKHESKDPVVGIFNTVFEELGKKALLVLGVGVLIGVGIVGLVWAFA